MNKISKTRKIYFLRLFGRVALFIFALFLAFNFKEQFDILTDLNFFSHLSPLHFFWVVWMADMIIQLIPVKAHISIGSQKQFKKMFVSSDETDIKKQITSSNKSALTVFVLWSALTLLIGFLYLKGVLNEPALFLICAFFYVADLICILIWCPFRLIMKNKCCTTCRIFNWDHLMMFSPFLFVKGFYTTTLAILALVIWLVWEVRLKLHPERFFEKTNTSLKCSECKDKLCTQYCKKRKSN